MYCRIDPAEERISVLEDDGSVEISRVGQGKNKEKIKENQNREYLNVWKRTNIYWEYAAG